MLNAIIAYKLIDVFNNRIKLENIYYKQIQSQELGNLMRLFEENGYDLYLVKKAEIK